MKISNLSKKGNLINLQDPNYSNIQNKYKLDYLCIINLSKLHFNYHNDILLDEEYGSFVKIYCSDVLTIRLFNPVYGKYIFDFNLQLGPNKNTGPRTKYFYSVLGSYKLFDLSKEELIYTEKEKGIYKTNINYNKVQLIKRAVVNSLERTEILKKEFEIEFFQY